MLFMYIVLALVLIIALVTAVGTWWARRRMEREIEAERRAARG